MPAAQPKVAKRSETETGKVPVTHDDMANAIRFLSMDAIEKAKSGHPGAPLGMADVATVLFSKYLKFDPADAKWDDRDRFVLSAGHGSMLLYSLLYLTGYEDMTIDEIKTFRQLHSKCAGHPEYGEAAGIETTTGPLGQGITNAVGMALAEKVLNDRYGDDVVNHFTYVIAGDGCLMEGISYEAVSLAGHLGLNKLIVFWDDNSISIDGPTELTQIHDHISGFQASGWDVQCINGHDPKAVEDAIEYARNSCTPSLICCETIIGYGAPTKAGTEATHGAPLGEAEVAGARENLNWPHEPFVVPDNILNAWRKIGKRWTKEREAWKERLDNIDPWKRAEFKRVMAGQLAPGWQQALSDLKNRFANEQPKMPTRLASGEALAIFTAAFPEMIGGSADLTASVNTKARGMKDLSASDFSGRYLRYGVREHAMAGIMNGIALHGGLIPYGGTFLVFADYMRGSMRLSALMGLRVIYVLTHDSIGLGEDGPTHQPVETLASLRAIPNMHVLRPADAVETSECWAIALIQNDIPTSLVLTRQAVPAVRKTLETENMCARGAYVLMEAEAGYEERKVTLMATGSEVSIAVEARETLEAEGIPTAVVSMPCWELFDMQSERYRDMVLRPGSVRVGVEAGLVQGWERYIGENGTFVGMTGFGASAPAPTLFEHFGITAENVVAAAKARM